MYRILIMESIFWGKNILESFEMIFSKHKVDYEKESAFIEKFMQGKYELLILNISEKEHAKEILKIAKKIRMIDSQIPIILVDEGMLAPRELLYIPFLTVIKKDLTTEEISIILKNVFEVYSIFKKRDIFIKTIDGFDILLGGKAIYFSNRKSKELLAILVNSYGGVVTPDRAISLLWPDRPFTHSTKTSFRTALKELNDVLKQHGIEDILIRRAKAKYIDMTKIQVDLQYLEEGELEKVMSESYLKDYDWCRESDNMLEFKCRKKSRF